LNQTALSPASPERGSWRCSPRMIRWWSATKSSWPHYMRPSAPFVAQRATKMLRFLQRRNKSKPPVKETLNRRSSSRRDGKVLSQHLQPSSFTGSPAKADALKGIPPVRWDSSVGFGCLRPPKPKPQKGPFGIAPIRWNPKENMFALLQHEHVPLLSQGLPKVKRTWSASKVSQSEIANFKRAHPHNVGVTRNRREFRYNSLITSMLEEAIKYCGLVLDCDIVSSKIKRGLRWFIFNPLFRTSIRDRRPGTPLKVLKEAQKGLLMSAWHHACRHQKVSTKL